MAFAYCKTGEQLAEEWLQLSLAASGLLRGARVDIPQQKALERELRLRFAGQSFTFAGAARVDVPATRKKSFLISILRKP